MKRTGILCLLVALAMLLCACSKKPKAEQDAPLPAEAPAASQDAAAEPQPETEAGAAEYVVADGRLLPGERITDGRRVFYEIFTGSFSDSDGDGTGDLQGVLHRLDYLNDGDPASGKSLGIGGIWLTPVFPSPSYHKYDVVDYFSVDPAFGTMEDLEALIAECHARDVLLILDLPLNHSSDRNDWFLRFVEARKTGDAASEYYDFYSCYDPASEQAPAGRTFRQIPDSPVYYECNFSGDMPEFNFDSQAVRERLLDVARFWLEKGVDGFRFDAAKYVYFGDPDGNMDFWAWYTDALRRIKPDIYMVGEVWDGDGITLQYAPYMNCFNFTASQTEGMIAATAKHGDVSTFTGYVQRHISRLEERRADAFPVLFIANHDTDRAAGYLTAASWTMQMAANLYILSPGSPFIYYGEELGMRGSRGGAPTDANRRLAMVWGDGDPVRDPEGADYDPKKQVQSTASEQVADPSSLYTYYKKLLMIRAANPEIAAGEYTPVRFPDTKAGGFLAGKDGKRVLVLHNTTMKEVTLDLSAATDFRPGELRAVIGQADASLDGTLVTIGEMTSVVLR